jgi:peptidoglycan/LPS O-acetylase OafA/YrhL
MATTPARTPDSQTITHAPVEIATIRPATSPRIPELDGLRGLAILLVIICHYVSNVPHGRSHTIASMVGTTLGLGGTGVDLFFILSGFLIGGILLDSKESNRYYQTFYLRRLHRIVPIYYLWIIFFAAISVFDARFSSIVPLWIYFSFLQNYFYQMAPMQAIWFGATWSLGVEEQFYLLAPPLLRNTPVKRLVKILLGVLVFCFLLRISLIVAFGNSAHDYWGLRAAYFATPSRADSLALGILLAIASRDRHILENIKNNLKFFKIGLVGCAFLIAGTLKWMVMPNYFFANTVGIPLFAGIYFCLLVISLTDLDGIIARTFRWRVLRELGKVSYCVYIIHLSVNWAAHKFARGDLPRFDSLRSIAVTIFALAVTLFIAELSWFCFERPLIRRGHRYKY